jgi:hypothetical protein
VLCETSCRRLWLSSHIDRALHRDHSVSGTCSPGTVLVDHGRVNIWGCVTGMCFLVVPGVPMGSRQGPPVICVSPRHVPHRLSLLSNMCSSRTTATSASTSCPDGVQEHVKRNPLSAKLRAKMAEVSWYLILRAPSVWAVTLFNKECHLSATAAGGIKSLAAAIGAISSSRRLQKYPSPIVPC